jgi:beta-galactosidase/beta-glucuronidase
MTGTQIPRPEYPRPQFERRSWINLNGEWSFVFDFGKSGMDEGRELFNSKGFEDRITVPFCPESELSGVGHTDFIDAMWYHRKIDIPSDWDGKRVMLNFGAVDYESEVFIDGTSVGSHFGGTVSFAHDISPYVQAGKQHDLVVRVLDEIHTAQQPGGKQSNRYKSAGCSYTRTTGIWQTVWLEAVGMEGLQTVQIVPDFDGGRFICTPAFYQEAQGLTLSATVQAGDNVVAEVSVAAVSGAPAVLELSEKRAWSMADPFLYDITFEVKAEDGRLIDTVSSYAGLRKVHIEGNQVLLNNEPIYQRLVLDQGFYPDGIWTAPTDEALKHDIELSLAAGFNGARLHQKVFEERFHYWADKLGYITWGEASSWGCDPNTIQGARNFLSEWREIVVRDRNHPSIIAWTPWNETGHITDAKQHRRSHIDARDICKDLDPTRPVNDSSGYVHYITDLWTVHTYEQDAVALKSQLEIKDETGVFRNVPKKENDYTGQPYLVDEFGGIKWIPEEDRAYADNSWGYGNAPKTQEEFYERLESHVQCLRELPHISGWCYTQLTDVEQEQNGIYRYNRSAKFDMARIKRIFQL